MAICATLSTLNISNVHFKNAHFLNVQCWYIVAQEGKQMKYGMKRVSQSLMKIVVKGMNKHSSG